MNTFGTSFDCCQTSECVVLRLEVEYQIGEKSRVEIMVCENHVPYA